MLTTDRFVIRESDSLIKEIYKGSKLTIHEYLIQIDEKGNEIMREDNQKNYRLPVIENNLKQ